MPREDLNALGISYRRIPLLAAGRDVYCDTRLILKKLEEWYPDGSLGAKTGEHKAIETLLQQWTDGIVFANAVLMIPTSQPILNNEKFVKDREEFTGRSWSKENIEKMAPAGLAEIVAAFQFLESNLLADGRQWILGTEKISLADIEGEPRDDRTYSHKFGFESFRAIYLLTLRFITAILPYHWLMEFEGACPPSHISENHFPKVFAWIKRFDDALAAAKSSAPEPITLKGADAIKQITGADFVEPEVSVDLNDPLGLKPGENIEVWPTDTGVNHRDQGHLVGLTSDEVVLECQTKMAEKVVRVHAPRRGFQIRRTTGEAGARL